MVGVCKIVHPKLSYRLVDLFFEPHDELGRHAREKQYGDFLETLFVRDGIQYQREALITKTGEDIE